MKFADLTLTGWGLGLGRRSLVYRPERQREMAQLLEEHRAAHKSLLIRGLGRSYGDCADNEGGSVALFERFDRILDFDAAQSLLEVEAGCSLASLLEFLVPRGFFLPVVPGTRFVTVGGALAHDIHGKNHHRDGSFADAVLEFRLRCADSVVRRCSREENPDLFWATAGGAGLTGVIETVRLRCLPIESQWMLGRGVRTASLAETFDRIEELEPKYRYGVAWIDLTRSSRRGSAVVLVGDHAPRSALSGRKATNALAYHPSRALRLPIVPFPFSNVTVRAFNTLYGALQNRPSDHLTPLDGYFFPLDRVDRWNRLYGKGGFSQFQCVLPFESAREGYGELLAKLAEARAVVPLAVLKTFGKSSGGWLSFPRPGMTLALDTPNRGPETVKLLRELAAISLHFNGRVYLAKDAVLEPISFFSMYPEAANFRAKLREWDPHRLFQSTAGRRVGLFEGA